MLGTENSLLVRIATDTSQLKAELDKAQNAISGWSSGVKSALGGILAGVSVGAAAGYFASITKAALEAADSMGDLSSAVGVPVETLSKFQLAAQTSGASLEMLGKGLKQLGITMVESVRDPAADSAKAFETLGVEVRDTATGALKPTEDVLLDLAESFSQMEDGAMKTALAADIFGKKIGPELIPFLNNGKAGLEELAATAEALGLTLDQKTVSAADRTNDMLTVLGQVSAGLGNKILKEVLPTLEGLAAQFLDTAKWSGALDAAAKSVAAAFKLIVSVGIGAFNALQAVGGALGGIVAAMTQALSGDFRSAWNTIKSVADDTGKRVIATGQQIGAVWDDSLGKVDEKTVALAKSMTVVDKNTKAAAKSVDEYGKAAKTVADLTAKSLGVSGDYVEKLRQLELWYSKNADKTEEYRRAVEALIWAQDSSKAIAKQQEEAEKALAKALADSASEREKSLDAYRKETDKIREKAAELGREVEQLGLTKEAQAALTIELRNAEIARLQSLATSDMVLLAGQDEVDSINARIDALQRLNSAEGNLAAKGALVEAAKKTETEWSRVTGQIEQALTDALVQGFSSGKSVVKSIGEWIKNYFLTNIARSIAQSITGALTAGLSGLANAAGFNIGNLIGGGSSASDAAGSALNLGSLASSILGGGSSFVAGIGSTLAGNASMAAFSGLLANGSYAAAAGMAAPYLLPVIAGIYGLTKLLGDKSSPAQQVFSNIGPGDIGYGRLATNPTGATYDQVVQPIVQSVSEIVSKLGGTIGNTTYGLFTSASPDGKGAQVVANVLGSGGGNIFYTNTNASNESMQERIADVLPQLLLAGLQDANLPEEFAAFFKDLDLGTASAQQINDAIAKAIEAKESKDVDVQAAQDATIDTAVYTGQSVSLMREQLDMLDRIRAGIEALADRAIEVTVNVPEVNGGVA